ncbi:MAG: ribosomal L7Ae/L30e/S12e/Gadd45 family protein [Clostridia bacterium]|nr:ribosomal L7Ae/L30e/S12e/Gadd45 family protein [Clostridia bacterium]
MISDMEKAALHVGYKQTMRALAENRAKKVFLAMDSEQKISVPVKELCTEKSVPFECVDTMQELGKMCGIEVRASCAVVLK